MAIEKLSLFLQDYKALVGNTAAFITIGQFLAGVFICKDIYKKKSTYGIPADPFVGGIVMGFLMLRYAVMLNDNAMLLVNIGAMILNVSYLIFYLIYTDNKGKVMKHLGYGGILIAVLYTYVHIENPELIKYRYGLIVTILVLILIGSPLFALKAVIAKKDASCIPFPIVLSGSVVSSLWFLYGIILLNYFMMFQHFIGLVLCVSQLLLCYLYPGETVKTKSK